MLTLFVLSFFVSLVGSVVLMRAARHARRYAPDMPQRFHSGDVSRLGGVAMGAGLLAGWAGGAFTTSSGDALYVRLNWSSVWPWLVCALPAFLAGTMEDLSHRVPVRYRLLLTAISAGLACWLFGAAVPRVDVPLFDRVLAMAPWLGLSLAFVAVTGLPHAFNLIDGYNGLAGTVALLVCLAIVHVALQVGDRQLAALVICMAGATAGFLAWNYPRGLIFAGDGGAYLWGAVIAIASIALVQRHPVVSPWFPMLLLIYPVWETIFSIYRKVARGGSAGVADALHFHQLIYRRVVRSVFEDDHARRMLMRNNRTSPYLWGFTILSVTPALLFWRDSMLLAAFCILFAFSYLGAYLMIIRFKVPRWLRR